MRSFVFRILAIFFLTAAAATVQIGTPGAEQLTIGTSTGYPPYYYESDGHLTGLCIDIIDETAKNIGLSVTYKSYPWKRMLHYGKIGEVDAVMPLFRTPERETFLHFFKNELIDEENSFFTRKDMPISFKGDLNDLKPFTIGVVDGYSYGSVFDTADFLNKVTLPTDRRLLELVARNRLDLAVGSRLVMLYFASLDGFSNTIRFLNPSVTKIPLYIGFSKAAKTRDRAEAFSKALENLKKTGFYSNLLKRYNME